jgi:hypothetical protein
MKLPLNCQYPPKLSIVSMCPFKLQKHVNVPSKTNKKIKMTINFFQQNKNVLINSKKKKKPKKKLKIKLKTKKK